MKLRGAVDTLTVAEDGIGTSRPVLTMTPSDLVIDRAGMNG